MSKTVVNQTSWVAGISFSEKEGPPNSYAYSRALDHRTYPKQLRLNPKAIKDSGTIVTDLVLWADRACSRTFFYGDEGNIYLKDSSGDWSLEHTAPDSSGNGMAYFDEDTNLYYASDTGLGRLTEACTGSDWYDDFLTSEGGTPTNTKSINLEEDDSMYANIADNASMSITSDLTMEIYAKPESLPSDNETMTLMGKWSEQNNDRSYKMDIATSSDFFGDGRDGALTISSDTTFDGEDANCTGTKGQFSITTSNESTDFSDISSGDRVLIHQTRGTGSGQYQIADVISYSSNTLTIKEPLTFSPAHSATASSANKAQVLWLKQYTNVTVNSGATWTGKAWDGQKGGILGFFASGTFTNNGTVNMKGKGFRGSRGTTDSWEGYPKNAPVTLGRYAEGTGGAIATGTNLNANGNGAGASGNGTDVLHQCGGSGGSNAAGATRGQKFSAFTNSGEIGNLSGSSNLTTATFGGGGSGCRIHESQDYKLGDGGDGGGILMVFGKTISISNTIIADGENGESTTGGDTAAGGAGAGGSILFKCQTITLGSNKVTANGGNGGTGTRVDGGDGGDGRIHIDYLTSVSGTSTPAYNSAQDSNLGSGDEYILRLLISDDGSSFDTFTWNITNDINTTNWIRWAISWEDTTSTAIAYKNGVSLGSKTGSKTSIDDNASNFAIGADFDSSGNDQNHFDGLLDDARLWNDVRTASELRRNNNKVLTGAEPNLTAYYEFTSDVTDTTSNGLDLTAQNSPTYSDDVPFSGVTSRNDQDQSNDGTGQTYTLQTAIDEGATHRISITPEKDPQKSVLVNINDIGTGDWTITVHDALNREVESVTVANSELTTGVYEFVFGDVWRPILDANYHIHITSTVADGVVVTGTSSDLTDAYFRTYYQILVEDEYHPITQHLNFMVIGNERYLAKLEAGAGLSGSGAGYEPHQLTLPSGYRIRCFSKWRDYLVIGTWRGTEITDYDQGYLFFWDGISDTYNHSFAVPEGGVNAMFGTQDVLFLVAGYTGEILIYTGSGSAQKFNRIPKIEKDEYVEIAPGSMAVWRTLVCMGVNLNTDAENIHKGVYTIGTASRYYDTSLGFDYPTSLGDQTDTNVKVGCVFPSGQDLYISWENNNSYGVDQVSVTNDCYETGELQGLITDFNEIAKDVYPLKLVADHEELDDGQEIRMKHKRNRDDWRYGEWQTTEDATKTILNISERAREFQYGIEIKSTTGKSPIIYGVNVETEMEERSGRRVE